MEKIYIETYGCQMNVYDTEIVRTILSKQNYHFTSNPEEADIIFLNTCSVREHAHRKVHHRINVLNQLRTKKKEIVLGILGCMAQNLRTELLDEKIGVDLIAGPDSYKNLPRMIKSLRSGKDKEYSLTLSEFETYSDVFPTRESGVNAWIAVMRGCDNFCTFCVVPYTRGRERSREPFNILDEVKQLAEEGFVQITLLGQNVNSYKFDSYDFADLIELVSQVDNIRRIRFTSPHPKDFPLKLLDVMSENEKVCEHIHLPLQSGNDRVLQMMNRTYTRNDFMNLVETIRRKIPGVVLTTDVIVGFPGETDDEYEDTLHVMHEVKFDSAFMFKYSERKNTIAARRYKDDISEAIKSERITRLVDEQRRISYRRNKQEIGKIFEVLIEGNAKKPDQLYGRNDGNKMIVFPKNDQLVGDFVNILIDEVTPNTLLGKVLT